MMTKEELDKGKKNLSKQIENLIKRKEEHEKEVGIMIYEAYSNVDWKNFDALEIGFPNQADADKLKKLLFSIKRTNELLKEVKKNLAELNTIQVCPVCGISIEGDELFCPSCGNRIMRNSAATDDKVCPQCGTLKKDDAIFCVNCGFHFEQEENQQPQPSKIQVRCCRNCGTELEDDAVFCFSCGARQ